MTLKNASLEGPLDGIESQFGFDAPVNNGIADELEVSCGHVGIFMRGSDR